MWYEGRTGENVGRSGVRSLPLCPSRGGGDRAESRPSYTADLFIDPTLAGNPLGGNSAVGVGSEEFPGDDEESLPFWRARAMERPEGSTLREVLRPAAVSVVAVEDVPTVLADTSVVVDAERSVVEYVDEVDRPGSPCPWWLLTGNMKSSRDDVSGGPGLCDDELKSICESAIVWALMSSWVRGT